MATVILVDLGEAAVLAAAKQALQQFATVLCLQPALGSSAAASVGPAPAPRRALGLCNVAKPPQSLKPTLQVRCRPGPLVLRDFHAAVGRLAPSPDGISGAMAAAALQQVVGAVALDGARSGTHGSVLYLTDRLAYEPDDFGGCLEICGSKGVDVHLLLLAAPDAGCGGEASAVEELARAWGAAEAAFPHLSVTLVHNASKASFDALTATLLRRFAPQPQLAVSLQFKQPLVGNARCLPLSCCAEVQPLRQALDHALLCPCHQAPTSASEGVGAWCAVTGAPLDSRQCRVDEQTVVVGGHPGGALHLSAPFNIANISAGSSGDASAAILAVTARVKMDGVNPAVMFGVPLLLLAAAQPGSSFKVVADGELADVSTRQLLEVLCSSLWAAQEALLARSTTDLQSGRAGLLCLHYLLQPCAAAPGRPATLCARRVACAEELLAPALGPPLAAAPPPLPAVVAEAVAGQLARVPLHTLEPLALSSRCHDTVEMLVRESQPMPALQAAPAPGGTAQVVPSTALPPPASTTPAPEVPPHAGPAGAQPAPARGRRPGMAALGPRAEAGELARQQAAGGRRNAAGSASGRGALAFSRTKRR